MLDSTIISFLETGCIGPVRCGASEESILGALGVPQGISTCGPRILKYGSLQIVIADRIVRDIYLYFDEGWCELPVRGGAKNELINVSLSCKGAGEVFSSIGVYWKVDDELTFGNQVCLRVGSGCHVLFDRDSGTIESIQVTERALPLHNGAGA